MGVNLGPFERICSIYQLELAFRVVKRKGGAPGIDRVTIEGFEKNFFEEITRLNQEVKMELPAKSSA